MSNQPLQQAEYNAADIAVLRERTEVLGRELRELKAEHRDQMREQKENMRLLADKLDAVLTVMSEARGGWRTVMLVGGMGTSVGAGLAWIFDHFVRRGG